MCFHAPSISDFLLHVKLYKSIYCIYHLIGRIYLWREKTPNIAFLICTELYVTKVL